MTDEIRRLLSGYAANSLSEHERAILFDAALQDQELFEALADEQELKELLDDPEARRELLAVLEETKAPDSPVVEMPHSGARKSGSWMIPSGIAAAVVLAVSVAYLYRGQHERPAETAQMAVNRDATPIQPAQPPVTEPRATSALPLAAPEPKRANTIATPPAGTLQARTPQTSAKESRTELDRAETAPPVIPAPATLPRPTPSTELTVSTSDAVTVTADAPLISPARQQAASSDGSAALEYTILKRTAAGDYIAVAPNTMFAAGDQLRLALESNQPGVVSVTQSKDAGAPGPSFVGRLQRAERVTLPENGFIRLDPNTTGTSLRLVFTSGVPAALQNSFIPKSVGVVGGMPAAQQRQSTSGKQKAEAKTVEAQHPSDQQTVQVQQAPSITIDLNLKVQKTDRKQ